MPTFRGARSAILLAALLVPAQSYGQRLVVPVGARARVQAPVLFPGRVIGTVMASEGDSLLFAIPVRGARPDTAGSVRRYVLTRPVVERLEISEGARHSTAAVRGAMVGLGLGSVYLLSMLALTSGTGWEPVAAYVGLIATGATTVTGALIGSMFTVEKWTQVVP